MIAFDVAEANQLLAAAETRLEYLAGITPSEERQLALEATRTSIAKLRAFLGVVPCGVPDCEFERARHDHEEDERDRFDEDPEWSPRSAYFDDDYNREGDPAFNGAFR